VGAGSVAIHRYRHPRQPHVPGLAGSALEGTSPEVPVRGPAEPRDHAGAWRETDVASPIAGATASRVRVYRFSERQNESTPGTRLPVHGIRGTWYAGKSLKGKDLIEWCQKNATKIFCWGVLTSGRSVGIQGSVCPKTWQGRFDHPVQTRAGVRRAVVVR